ncbi:MAG: AAA family ATPase [Bacteroidales bacterium]|nr:AAA family ATPase [Candidatus Colicola caccequi]
MKSIGFKNFRRFEELLPLQLGDITFFVGANNAGKSTAVKAMMLMLDNLASRSVVNRNNIFEPPGFRLDANRIHEVHIGTFGRALHRPYPETKELTIAATIDNYLVRYTITGDTDSRQANADVAKIEVENVVDKVCYVFDFQNGESVVNYNTSVLKKYAVGIDEGVPFEYILRRGGVQGYRRETREKMEMQQQLEQLLQTKARLQHEQKREDNPIEIARINSELQSIEKNIKTIQKMADPFEGKLKEEDVEYKSTIKISHRMMVGNFVSAVIEGLTEDFVGEEESSEDYSSASADRKYDKLSKQKKAFLMMLMSDARQLSMVVRSNRIEYISAHAASQKVLFSIEDKNDYMAGVIREFKQRSIMPGSKEDLFVTTWMKNLQIGLDYQIEPISGEAYTMDITNMCGETMPLADLGMGSIQMMILLLKLATIINANRGEGCVIIVEEPEQNIHPKLQSKLADLIAYVNREYGFRFVIETHSEYLIRRTQAMIATEEVQFEKNPFKVYYFPEEGEPYDMVYQESGLFKKKFDEGFFDEASRQHVVVIKKVRELQ